MVETAADEAAISIFFFFQAEDGIRDDLVTGVQTCALPISIALLSTKAEYMAMTHSGKEVIFLNHLFNDLEIPIQLLISLLVDNQSAIALAENPIFHACSKHIKVCHHWMHEKTGDGTIQLEYVPTADQVMDIFTKLLNSEKFRKFHDALGLVRISVH